jgi:hypothetical protein
MTESDLLEKFLATGSITPPGLTMKHIYNCPTKPPLSTKEANALATQFFDKIIDDYLLDIVSQCSYEAQDSDDEMQAFKDLLWNTIQTRLSK